LNQVLCLVDIAGECISLSKERSALLQEEVIEGVGHGQVNSLLTDV
jgi:hypothetical protein